MPLTLRYFSCQTCHFHLISLMMHMTLTLSYFSCQTCHFHLVSLTMPMTLTLRYFSCQISHFHVVSCTMLGTLVVKLMIFVWTCSRINNDVHLRHPSIAVEFMWMLCSYYAYVVFEIMSMLCSMLEEEFDLILLELELCWS